MQNKEQQALLVHRENYEVPKGQEQVVHYKIAKLDAHGKVLEPARICHDEPKLFETVLKRNLEILGYTVEILHHPDGRYSSVKIETAEEKLALKDLEIQKLKEQVAQKEGNALSEKDAEIERLKAELAKAKAEKKAEKPTKPAKEAKEGKKETKEKKEA
jgi:hypothetical protein